MIAFRRPFQDRTHAGRELAKRLSRYRQESSVVLGLTRGGVPVAYEVAHALEAPLDVWVVRKVGAPMRPELGMGAVSEGGGTFIDGHIVQDVGATSAEVERIVACKAAEVEERRKRYRRGREALDVSDKTVLLVDDGIATGGTVRAALTALRRKGPRRLVVAVPVASAGTLESLATEADEIVCLHPRSDLFAVGLWYEDFARVEDDEVLALLDLARARGGGAVERSVHVAIGEAELLGDLTVPAGARGLVLFAHGSGSSRRSPRNRFVANALQQAGMATLLFDLLTQREEREDAIDARLRVDVDLLARRIVQATDWARQQAESRDLRIGYFGASTGAAAALIAAVERADVVGAVVSRGGRPDLAGEWLQRLRAPAMFIVGGDDRKVLELTRVAMRRVHAPKLLAIVPHATHLFEEPGALDRVAGGAVYWFRRHLAAAGVETQPITPQAPEWAAHPAERDLHAADAEVQAMQCSEIMKGKIECIGSAVTISDAAKRMYDSNIGFLPVCDTSGAVLGTITDRDIAMRVVALGLPTSTPVADVMSREVVACRPGDDASVAAQQMAKHHKSRVMCLDDEGHLVGVISLSDLAMRSDASTTLREVASREAHA